MNNYNSDPFAQKACNSSRLGGLGTSMMCSDNNKIVIQGANQPPIIKHTGELRKGDGKAEKMANQINIVNVEEGDIRLDARMSHDSFSEEIVARIQESGSVVKNFVTLKTDNEYGSTNYYEAVSRAGDDYLIEIPKQSKTVQIYSQDEKNGISSLYTETAAKVVPILNPPSSGCPDDPICSSIFKCNSINSDCMGNGEVSLVTFSKCDMNIDGISIGTFADRKIGVPIVKYHYLISNLSKITVEVARVSQFITMASIDSSLFALSEAAAVYDVESERTKSELKSIRNSMIEAKDRSTQASEIIKLWEDVGSIHEEDYLKYKNLVSRRIEYKNIINNVFDISDMFKKEVDEMIKSQFRFSAEIVKMWIEYTLYIDSDSTATAADTSSGFVYGVDKNWLFFDHMKTIKKDDLVSYILGMGANNGEEERFEKKIKEDSSITSFSSQKFKHNNVTDEEFAMMQKQAYYRNINYFVVGDAKNKMLRAQMAIRKNLVKDKGNVENQITDYSKKFNDAIKNSVDNVKVAAELMEKLISYSILKGTAIKVGPILKSKLSLIKDMSADCPDGKVCGNYDDEEGKFSVIAGGNLSSIGDVSAGKAEYIKGAISLEVDKILKEFDF